MSKALTAAQRSLDLIQDVLSEKASEVRVHGRRRPVCAREHLLKVLRKLAVGGNVVAFEIMNRELVEHPRAMARLHAAFLRNSEDGLSPMLRGGVFTVPPGESVERVAEMLKRGITADELAALRKLNAA